MKIISVIVSSVFVLAVLSPLQAADIINNCDALTEFILPVYDSGYSQEGAVEIGSGNPSGDAIWFVTRTYNNHFFTWNITPTVVVGDRFYFDVRNDDGLGSAWLEVEVKHDGGQSYNVAINGLADGHTLADGSGWQSCYIEMASGISEIECIRLWVSESQRVLYVDNFRLTQLCPESTTISIRTLPASPSTTEIYAAKQLRTAFQAALHVTPLINPVTEKSIKIRLGLAGQFSPGVGDSNAQAYVIRKPSAGLFELVGNSPPAVLWAVDDFSRRVLNVNWTVASILVPDVNGTPADLNSVSLSQIGVPGIMQRGWLLDDNINGYGYENNIANWMSHNRQNNTIVQYTYLTDDNDPLNPKDRLLERGIGVDTSVHSFYYLVPPAMYDAHPTYFPLIDGVRVEPTDSTSTYVQLCISNPAVQQIMIDAAKAAFAAHPEVKTFGIVPNDGSGGWCTCANCVAMDKADPIANSCDALTEFILPVYDSGYSQEGAVEIGAGNPSGDAIWFVTRTYNNHFFTWDITPTVITGDRFYFDVKNDVGLGSAWMEVEVLHDGSQSYNVAINGLADGHTLADGSGWKSCYIEMASGIYNIECIRLWVRESQRVLYVDNFQLTQNSGDQTTVYSNRLMHLVNKIAQATRSEYPDQYISTLSYGDYAEAPATNVENNVSVTFAVVPNLMKSLTDANDAFNAAQMAELSGWLAKTPNILLWEYYWYSGSDYCPPPFTRVMCQEIAALRQLGIKGLSPETRYSRWHNMGLLNYAFAQMTWNPSLTFDTILSDYCKARYGPAASSMQSYHSMYESTARTNGFALNAIVGAGEQCIPAAFTDGNITTLTGYLDTAHTTAETSGTLPQRYAVNQERDEFRQFCRTRVDPVGITGIGSNVISNPGAESGTTDWGTHVESGSYSLAIDTSIKHVGTKSFKITNTGAVGNGRWYQTNRTVTSGRKYGVSFWVYATGGAYGDVLVISGSNRIEVFYSDTDSQWIRIICPEITADGSLLNIYLQNWGTGTIYFDDVFVASLPVPTAASATSPANSATGVSIAQKLSWTTGSYTTSHDVYFGTSQSDVSNATHSSAVYRGNQTGTTYNPGTLAASTTYYWRVDEVGNGQVAAGTVWSFTTNDGTPVFIAAGAVTSNTTAITPALPAGIATNDILLLFLETSNQAISISNQNGGTWTQVTNSPQYCGTAAGTTGARFTAFWSRYNGTQGAPTTSDSGDHQLGMMIAIRGAAESGNPWDVTAGGVEAVSDTSGSIPGVTTTVANTLVVTAIASSLPDASSTAKFSAWTNANLTSLTERIDNSVTAGNGGGLGVATGIKATAGAYGNTTLTLANSAYKGMMSIAIKP